VQFVHGATPNTNLGQRRKWTGLAVAFTVGFSVCNAGSALALSPQVCGNLPSFAFLSSFQIKRPEQKTPHDLNVVRATSDPRVSRSSASGSVLFAETFPENQTLGAGNALGWKIFGTTTDSCESPRAPPLMDPPISS
jgi:hypothetical protein